MFDAVKKMNVAFGNAEGDHGDFEPMPTTEGCESIVHNETAWKRLEKQCYNIGGKPGGPIASEVKELLDALAARDVEGTRDALCDIIVFALGAYHIMGYDADKDMKSVVDGVMTRFCTNMQQVIETKLKYEHLGVLLRQEGEFPFVCLKSTHDQVGWDGDTYPEGKFVKSVGYHKAVFYIPEPKCVKPNTSGFSRRARDVSYTPGNDEGSITN